MGCLSSCLRESTSPRQHQRIRAQTPPRSPTSTDYYGNRDFSFDFTYSYRHRGSTSTPFPLAKNPAAPELLEPKNADSTFTYWSDESKSSEEIECPICFDGYTIQNPMITIKCSHHYHLSCIYEWMNMSDTCPACRQVIVFDNPELQDTRY
ncbi:hypothetical protein RYX36_007342 [Vicia faba]